MMTPKKFSIVMPAYNRATLIGRAIESCLCQDFGDFEILVVDDASTDGTADAVAAFRDCRIVLHRHAVNRGVSNARNTAIASAKGEWCVMVDTDFALLPGALTSLARRCATAPRDVANVASMCTWDRGPDTPYPAPTTDLLLDYPDFLRFIATLKVSEWFNCIRRSALDRVRFPDARAYEGGFHLALARRFRFSLSRERCVRVFTDAPNRITASPPQDDARRVVRDALDCAREAEAILAEHGPAFRKHAPALWVSYARTAIEQNLLAGRRATALRILMSDLAALGSSPSLLAIVGVGFLGPLPLAWARSRLRSYRGKRVVQQ